ncbi:tRNA 2-selenouridine(34) synthase MnmH [Segetibacter sp. 3557_3]|uniref:tRNA 2-selenouridine(34) synthase MnmH n=1 Tax=Segetibacter sp. 3557_3 TaxID=2547429 RepID=UPI0010590DE5|nr:tRNA 2-selenouridine(34) synthase MnmH [Segetibacter sp. 3557_3]TDH19721.1 tRNA 2-selenouridine(34) synthase MnmH [Segetibacter sp. 3557_3]
MAVVPLDVARFMQDFTSYPVVDVRSEGEYLQAHIPNAVSLPLFNNEERKIVGTTYKQQSREEAIKLGLDILGGKMRKMVEAAEQITADPENYQNTKKPLPGQHDNNKKTIVVHCWRGGMRSGGVAWLLDLYGFKVYTIAGGYKAYRNWVLQQFSKPYHFRILGGYTGSGKTPTLLKMKGAGAITINLEGLAHHKGSAFGSMGMAKQPSQEMFENTLATNLAWATKSLQRSKQNPEDTDDMPIWLEDESQRIGNVNIPGELWQTMRSAPVFFLDIPFEQRLKHIVEGYGKCSKEELINSIIRIKKRLGGLETKEAVNYLLEDDIEGSARILLSYYDKLYAKALTNRSTPGTNIQTIFCTEVDPATNAQKILNFKHD